MLMANKRKMNGGIKFKNQKSQKLASMSDSDMVKLVTNGNDSDSDEDSQISEEDGLQESVRDDAEEDNEADTDDDDDDDSSVGDGDDDVNEEVEEENDRSGEGQNSNSEEDGESDTGSGTGVMDSKQHKKSLQKLKDTDPEFYKFLQENDKTLLAFSGSEDDDDEEEEEEEDDAEEDKLHKPPESLEVASDESDLETPDGEDRDKRVVTLMMINSLQKRLQNKCSVEDLKAAVQMFHSALIRVTGASEEDSELADFIVDRSAVFNGIMQMCMFELQPAIMRILGVTSESAQLNKAKKWSRVKPLLRMYLTDISKFLDNVVSSEVLTVLLKHLHQMAPFLPYFPSRRRPLLKYLVKLWGTSEETVRVGAFVCLLKFTKNQMEEIYIKVLKMMNLTYVKNCMFVSPSSLPTISFMRRSLVEMFCLDAAAAYQQVFLYIRQLAITLRNAIVLHKQESMQAVYNWQYVMSLHLWVELLGKTVNNAHLQPLIYPLVQVIIGTIKLIPTAQYYPLRFHCVQFLIQLSKQTETFIPILPFITEVLVGFDFNKHHKKVSMKPLDLTCILRFSKSQLQENGCKDAIMEKIYEQLMEYLANEAHTIGFPDLVVPLVMQIKKFLKDCKSPNYTRTMKQALEKIEENAKFVENARRTVSFSLTDQKAIDAWETKLKLKGTPLAKFYESWNKVHKQKMLKRITQNEKLGEYNFPILKKPNKKDVKVEGPTELFPSSSDEADEDNMKLLPVGKEKGQRGTRGGKRKSKTSRKAIEEMDIDNFSEGDHSDGHDVVKDMKLSDFY